jgi:hypothetical protein
MRRYRGGRCRTRAWRLRCITGEVPELLICKSYPYVASGFGFSRKIPDQGRQNYLAPFSFVRMRRTGISAAVRPPPVLRAAAMTPRTPPTTIGG